jgi:arylsulfatase A-like enzyme
VKILTPFSVAVLFGGLAACLQAAYNVRAHRYIEYGMFRLAAELLRVAVNEWLFISLAVGIVMVLVYGCAVALSNAFACDVRNPKAAGVVGSAALLIGVALLCWGMDTFIFTHYHFRVRWRAVLIVLITLACLVPGMLYIWRVWHPSFLTRLSVPVLASGFIYGFLAVMLNSFLYIDTSRAPNVQKPNVVLIVIDCLRARDLGYWGSTLNASPAIDLLAAQGVAFKNAYCNAPWTRPSVASLFTSQYPGTHNAIGYDDVLSKRWLTLAEVLKNANYHTCFFNGGNYNFARPFNFQQGFDCFDFEFTQKNAAVLTDKFLSHMQQPVRQPFFAYVHYMDAHQPYKKNTFSEAFVADSNILFDPATEATEIELMAFFGIVRKLHWAGKLTANDHAYLKGLYNSQIRFIDENIQRIVAFLERERLYDNTIIIITADHGEEFWEHDNYEHGHSLYNELLHVPLIIAGAQIEQRIVHEAVQLIDIMPTVADLLRIPLLGGYCQGMSLYTAIAEGGTVPKMHVYASGTRYGDEKFCIIADNKKVILNTGDSSNKGPLIGYTNRERFEYYNVSDDPLEQDTLAEDASVTFPLLKDTLVHFSDTVSSDSQQKAVVGRELRQKLESIGYVQ